jgi:CubicO group peptidase (beta-lactamase class C family)
MPARLTETTDRISVTNLRSALFFGSSRNSGSPVGERGFLRENTESTKFERVSRKSVMKNFLRETMMRASILTTPILLLAVPLQSQPLAVRVDSIFRAAEAGGFSGVVRLEMGGALILEKGYGLANRRQKIPYGPATVVQIGSNTKDFTAVAILQLVERGYLTLDDPISRFFPWAQGEKSSITVRQLLDHRAGFPLGLGGDFDPLERQQFIDSALSVKLLFKPGEQRSYSNTGYGLLAAIIERLSAKSYDEYVRDNILRPIGLRNTGLHLPSFPTIRLAHGYRADGEDAGTMVSKPHLPDGPYWNLRGNGGMLSTLSDMHRFYRALFETDSLIRPETRALRFNPREPIALAGSDLVSMFLYERDPARGMEVIVASNSQDYKVPRVMSEVRKLPEFSGPIVSGGPAQQVVTGIDRPRATRPGDAPPARIASIVNELVTAFNGGDEATLRAFVQARFLLEPGGPTVVERSERLARLARELGSIRVVSMVAVANGPVEVSVTTAKDGPALLILDFDPAPPHRIRRFGVQAGN